MYDELARSQRPTLLEWAFLHVLLPSLGLTILLRIFAQPGCSLAPIQLKERVSVEVLPVVTFGEPGPTPVLLSIQRPLYPVDLRRAAREGRVVLKGVLDERGRVRSSSIEVLQTADSRFDDTARRALRTALFWPAAWDGEEISVTMVFDFNLDRELTNARY